MNYENNIEPSLIVAYTLIFLIILLLVLIPTWIAIYRRSKNRTWIFLFNFLLGGLVVTWIAAFIWSLCDKKEVR